MTQAAVKIREAVARTQATNRFLEDFLTLQTGESETAVIRRFRAWVRQQIANNWDQ